MSLKLNLKMKNSVLFFGPYPKPVTGQSMAFKEVFDHFDSPKLLCNITKFEENKILNTLYVFICIPKLFLFNKINVVYFTCSRSNLGFIKDLYVILFAYLAKARIINHLHGADFNSFFENSSSFLKNLIKWAYNKVQTSIVLTDGMEKEFQHFDKMTVKVIPNSYPKAFNEIPFEHLKNIKKSEGFNIIFLSNIMYSKGIVFFLESLPFLLTKHINLTVSIAGVPMGDYLKNKSEISNIFFDGLEKLKDKFPNRINYYGLASGKFKEKILQKSSIFILPTIYKTEAFPLTIIEAMYYGNVIVTTNHNYLPGIVKEKNGILIGCGSVDDIQNSIDCLLENPESLNLMQKKNYNESREIYNPNRFCNSVYNLILKIA
ncbi:glycosyltransferase involved in cell wall biosynthesis [Chryseobacterium sp. SORGH_AS 447]|nr:glycosyltransferase involved in cell wall biosynthesis [Chryseobacterium sp. SORGH_AS_0447]